MPGSRIQRHNPDGLPRQRVSIYAHAVSVSGPARTIYLAGQVARDEKGATVGVGDVQAQTEQVLCNLEQALAAAGATLRDVVKVTVYTTDLRYNPIIDEVRRRFFTETVPASTLLEVRKLSHPDYLVEIDGIAVVP